jgi:radical SAM superfamily enzyme YgiQ (UPF0313 family)
VKAFDEVLIILPPITADACSQEMMRSFVFAVHAMARSVAAQAVLLDFLDDRPGFRKFCRQMPCGGRPGQVYVVALFANNWSNGLSLIRRLRPSSARHRGRLVVMGPLAAYFYEEILQRGWADIVIRRDAEFVVPDLLKGEGDWQGRTGLHNMAWKKDGRVITTPLRTVGDLDNVPFLSPYFLERSLVPVVLTARGCPFPCSFCDRKGLWGKCPRFRSEENVLAELRMLAQRGGRRLFFVDDTFTMDSDRVKRICAGMIRENLPLNWTAETRVDMVSRVLLKMMKRAGCEKIYYGIESGSARIRRSLGKDFSDQVIQNAVKWTRDTGIKVGLFVIVGSPREAASDFAQTLSLLKQLAPFHSLDVTRMALLPGTPLYEAYLRREGLERGFILDRDWPVYFREDSKAWARKLNKLVLRLREKIA